MWNHVKPIACLNLLFVGSLNLLAIRAEWKGLEYTGVGPGSHPPNSNLSIKAFVLGLGLGLGLLISLGRCSCSNVSLFSINGFNCVKEGCTRVKWKH